MEAEVGLSVGLRSRVCQNLKNNLKIKRYDKRKRIKNWELFRKNGW